MDAIYWNTCYLNLALDALDGIYAFETLIVFISNYCYLAFYAMDVIHVIEIYLAILLFTLWTYQVNLTLLKLNTCSCCLATHAMDSIKILQSTRSCNIAAHAIHSARILFISRSHYSHYVYVHVLNYWNTYSSCLAIYAMYAIYFTEIHILVVLLFPLCTWFSLLKYIILAVLRFSLCTRFTLLKRILMIGDVLVEKSSTKKYPEKEYLNVVKRIFLRGLAIHAMYTICSTEIHFLRSW